jgi:hypothetical protein
MILSRMETGTKLMNWSPDMFAKAKRLRGAALIGGLAAVVLLGFLCGCESSDDDNSDWGLIDDEETDAVDSENRRREKISPVDKQVSAADLNHTEIPDGKVAATQAASLASEDIRTASRIRAARTLSPYVVGTIDDSKQMRDVRGLLVTLENEQGKARGRAAVTLSGAVRKVENAASLAECITPLLKAKLKDDDATVHEYSGRALMYVLHKVDDQWALQPPVEAFVDTLVSDSTSLKQRQFAAVALATSVPKIKDEIFLVGVLQPLLVAKAKDPDKGVREYSGRALMRILQKINDPESLQTAAEALIDTLEGASATLKQRQFAAVALSVVAMKIKDKPFLARMLWPLVMAATCDGDKGVREYAGRAFLHSQRKVVNEAALESVLAPLVETLWHKDVKMRGYAAWALAELVPKITNEAMLKAAVGPLESSASNGPSRHARQACQRALKSIRKRFKPPDATGSKK